MTSRCRKALIPDPGRSSAYRAWLLVPMLFSPPGMSSRCAEFLKSYSSIVATLARPRPLSIANTRFWRRIWGVQFINTGVKAVVAAGWAVNDAAAVLFAETFHTQMLRGEQFGDTVREARRKALVGEVEQSLEELEFSPDLQPLKAGCESRRAIRACALAAALWSRLPATEFMPAVDNIAEQLGGSCRVVVGGMS